MASIDLEKKKTAGKKEQILFWLLSTKLLQVYFKVEAKVLRYKFKVTTLNLTHYKKICISGWEGCFRARSTGW